MIQFCAAGECCQQDRNRGFPGFDLACLVSDRVVQFHIASVSEGVRQRLSNIKIIWEAFPVGCRPLRAEYSWCLERHGLGIFNRKICNQELRHTCLGCQLHDVDTLAKLPRLQQRAFALFDRNGIRVEVLSAKTVAAEHLRMEVMAGCSISWSSLGDGGHRVTR